MQEARLDHDRNVYYVLLDARPNSAAEGALGAASGSASRPTAARGAESGSAEGVSVAGAWQRLGCGDEREREYTMLEQQVRLGVSRQWQCVSRIPYLGLHALSGVAVAGAL